MPLILLLPLYLPTAIISALLFALMGLGLMLLTSKDEVQHA